MSILHAVIYKSNSTLSPFQGFPQYLNRDDFVAGFKCTDNHEMISLYKWSILQISSRSSPFNSSLQKEK